VGNSVAEGTVVAKQQLPPDDGPGGDESQTSTRLFSADNDDLKQLAAMLRISAAEAYRRVCRPVVRTALRAELKRRSAELDRDQK
jgi:hypothetical protein